MLTDREIAKIFSWQPYRDNWTVDRNQADDNINSFYGNLIDKLTKNALFDTYYSENGGLGNYSNLFAIQKDMILTQAMLC